VNVKLSIILEPFSRKDMDRLISWIPSAEFLLQWAGPTFTYPLDRVQLLQYLAESENDESGCLIFRAVNSDTGETVGHGELKGIDRRNHSARIARMLVGPVGLRNSGVGDSIVRELLVTAFEDLGLHRVELNVFDFNKPAIHCYEKVGFKKEGVLREARKHGDQYWNLCIMGILKHEYQERGVSHTCG